MSRLLFLFLGCQHSLEMSLSSGSEPDLDSAAHEYIEELQLRNSRPLHPDLLALFLDAKYVEVKKGRPAAP